MTLAKVLELHKKRSVGQGCLCMENDQRCQRPAMWAVRIVCVTCGMKGDGPACGWHKVQADEWGVPHYDGEGLVCATNAPIDAIPLR